MVELEMYLLCLHQPVYFLLLYGMTYGYAWISTGNMSMSGQQIALSLYYGEEVANTSMPELIRMTVLLPVLAGIVQSMMQLLLSLYMNSAAVMSVITFILVLASYYGNRFWCMDMRWRAGIILTVCIRRMRCLQPRLGFHISFA